MLARLLPPSFGRDFSGLAAARWLLLPLAVVKLLMGVNAAVLTRMVATRADGLPLERYGEGAANNILALLAAWGVGQALLTALGLLAVFRYRAMIPLIYLLLLVEQLARKLIYLQHPVVRSTAGSGGLSTATIINTALLALLALGFVLSLWPRSAETSKSVA